jgi:ATP-dependent RNA helicase DeaD
MTFEEMGLSPEIIKATADLGYTHPTKIQELAIPTILGSTEDLIAQAQTGTGKTAAFGLPIIQEIEPYVPVIQALVLSPTRELGIQIWKDFESFSKYVKGIETVPVYGGANITHQIKALRKGCQIVVGTPGRILDLVRRKVLKLSSIKWLVLDEADEMLNMGFQEDLDAILASIPDEKQTFLFSATMPPQIVRIASRYMHQPKEIAAGKRNAGAENVHHKYYMVHARDRYETLKRIADVNPNIYGIVFCRTRAETKEVARKLAHDGYNADALYGDLTQAQRDEVMQRFRSKQLQILVATDVAARGLDVNDLTHVINYELPGDLEVYIHRSGRTGRAGKSGISISIIHTRESRKIRDLERMSRKTFEQALVPTGREICEKQLYSLVDKVEKIEVNETQIEQYLPAIQEKLGSLSKEELMKHFISVEFNRFLSYYKNARDLNVKRNPKREERRSMDKSRNRTNYARFLLNIGSKHGLSAQRLMGIINERMDGQRISIGKIEIKRGSTFFEIEEKFADNFSSRFKKINFEGIPMIVEPSGDSKAGSKPRRSQEPFVKSRQKRRSSRKWKGKN